jgi:hypothetical protein
MTAGRIAALVPISEKEWQDQVVELATMHGWLWAHWRAAMTQHGWRTPVSGPIGAGFPDRILVHPRRQLVVFVELKRDGQHPTREQRAVHDVLRRSGLRVETWHPADWDKVVETLSAGVLHEPAADRGQLRSGSVTGRSRSASAAGIHTSTSSTRRSS